MDLTPDQILGFTNLFLVKRFDSPQPTPDFHVDLWEHACSSARYVAIAAPRGHAKSTAVTHSFTLACIVWRIKKHILVVSDTEGQAIQFVQDIKRELIENEELIDTFGLNGLVKETEKEIIGRFKDGSEFRIVAAGSGQKLRGMKWRSARPDLVIGDDLENDEIVMNEERRNKFRQWAFNALLPVGSDTCHYRFIGTILHLDSFLESLMPNPLSPNTIVEPLKIYSEKTTKGWLSVKYRAHPSQGDFSSILWKEKFPQERLEEIRNLYLEQGFPEGYSQEYLNNPIDDTNAYFRKQDFIPIPEEELYPNRRYSSPEEFYAAIDMAISEKDARAYTVIVVCGLTPGGILRVREVRRFRGDSLTIMREMFSVQEKYKPELFVVEKENIANAIGPVLRTEMGRNGKPFIRIEELPPHGQDKIKRARSIQYRMRAGRVEFDTEAEWYPDLQHEMMHFPRGKFSDQVDALAWIGLILDKMDDVPTWKQIDEQEYEDEKADMFDTDYSGRDFITGY